MAILAAVNSKIPIFEYSPAQVKQRVASYGASSKEQIQQMVRLQLGLDEIPEPNDAADALAVALCHLSEIHVTGLLGDEPKTKGEKHDCQFAGVIDAISTDSVIVNIGGVGFKVAVPTSVIAEGGIIGSDIKLYTHLHVREDDLSLYGFDSPTA